MKIGEEQKEFHFSIVTFEKQAKCHVMIRCNDGFFDFGMHKDENNYWQVNNQLLPSWFKKIQSELAMAINEHLKTTSDYSS